MNYEELLAARLEGKQHKAPVHIGDYYREQVDGKWRGIVDIRPELNQNIVFSEALKHECEQNKTLNNNHLLHYTPNMNSQGEVTQLELELGHYQTFAQLLNDNPAIVAQDGFIDATLEALLSTASYLHGKGIMQICFSPNNVLARKGDGSVVLLSHGSYYMAMSDLHELYGDDTRYIAPEVLNHGTVDDRCDIYSIGRFMESVLHQSDMPLEYRRVIKKATSEAPEDRYESPEAMLKALHQKRNTYRSIVTTVIAVVIALLCIALYFDMFPESSPIEFVKPAPRQPTDDLLDDGFDPAELGVTNSGDTLTFDDGATEEEYMAKAEEIFRKKYEKEADRILSRIYNKDYMSNSEKQFLSESQSTIDELMKKQAEMGAEAGLTPERAQLLATQIIDRITEQKKKELGGTNSRAIQKGEPKKE